MSARRRRLAMGGTQSTLLAASAQPMLPAPVRTGIGG